MTIADPFLPSAKNLEVRAAASLSATPRPFLKWAGSKRRFLADLIAHLPASFSTYYEPFLGGGALFFLLQPPRAVLGDMAGPLVETYTAIRDNPSAVLRYLSWLVPDREVFYLIRERRTNGQFKRAAEFIYLNKTCWNGLYRVNMQGKFNVPYGRPSELPVADHENIMSCAEALSMSGIRIQQGDFEETLNGAGLGDLVFLDPPYVTGHTNNGFRDYNEVLFSWNDQVRLALVAERLRVSGATVLVTNANHPSIREMYRSFEHHLITTRSTIAG